MYLCLSRIHWISQSPTNTKPLISQMEKAHSTLSNRSKNLSGSGGVCSFEGTRSWTTEIVIVVVTKQTTAYRKARPVFPHSVGNEERIGSAVGMAIWIISFLKSCVPFCRSLVAPFGNPPRCPLALPFLWASMWFSILSVSIFSRSCRPPSDDTRESGAIWKSMLLSLSKAWPSIWLRGSTYSDIPSLLSQSETSLADHCATFFIFASGQSRGIRRSLNSRERSQRLQWLCGSRTVPVLAHDVLLHPKGSQGVGS